VEAGFREYIEQLRAERAAFVAEVEDEVARTGAYVRPMRGTPGRYVSLTRSTRPRIDWQVTYWDGDPDRDPTAEPSGHIDVVGTVADAAKDLVGSVERARALTPNARLCLAARDLASYLNISEPDPYDFIYLFDDWKEKVGFDGELEDLEGHPDAMKEFREYMDDGIQEAYRWDPTSMPAYLWFDNATVLPAGTWLVHFTSKYFTDFRYGTTLEGLHLSTHTSTKSEADCALNLEEDATLFEIVWSFALEAFDSAHWSDMARTYGREVLLFRTDCAVKAWHNTDNQWQVIFPACSEYDVFTGEYDGSFRFESEDADGDHMQEWFRTPGEAIEWLEELGAVEKMAPNPDSLPGGLADRLGITESDVDPEQLRLGIQTELEHTSDPDIAKEIALDHLAERADYYTMLLAAEGAGMTANATRKKWVNALLGKREAIQRAISVPLGDLLGCGHWGCVFESANPWVVKLSIDPTEGPAWSKIAGLVQGEQWGQDGFTEIKGIYRLTPDLVIGGRKRKVWAIVREGVEPVFKEYNARELGEHGGGKILATSDYTNRVLGLPSATRLETAELPGSPRAQDVSSMIKGLRLYRDAATAWHVLGAQQRWSPRVQRERSYYRDHLGIRTRDVAMDRALRALRGYFHGPSAAPLGESLEMLATNDVLLRDVHLLNIGWHVPRDDDDWARIVIFDPGHTPTVGTWEIPERLIHNTR